LSEVSFERRSDSGAKKSTLSLPSLAPPSLVLSSCSLFSFSSCGGEPRTPAVDLPNSRPLNENNALEKKQLLESKRWAAVNFAPGGDVYFICALNSFVHVLMYGYYLASSTGIKVPSFFKKSITRVQMVQFGLLNAQALYGVFVASYYRPRIVVVMALIQSVVFMSLFANFYRQAYKSAAAAKKAAGGSKKRA
jgi:hypothetical protein